MDLQEALHIFEIENVSNLSLEYLKKKYHKMALQNHPDKNGNTIESKERFQRINESYEVLKREISIINNGLDENINIGNTANTGYNAILHLFVDGILKGKYNEYISSIIKDIVSGCKEISLKLFEDMDKDQSLAVYNFIIKYKYILHINDDTLEKVKTILLDKFKDMQIYVINPSISDLFQNNVYKLKVNDIIYFVPLWHSELHFDPDIIVKCYPELPDNVVIDEDNNLIITERISFTYSLFTTKNLIVNLKGYSFSIPIDQLYIRPIQTYVLKNKGISKIIENDIYCVEEKADVIIKIIFD